MLVKKPLKKHNDRGSITPPFSLNINSDFQPVRQIENLQEPKVNVNSRNQWFLDVSKPRNN